MANNSGLEFSLLFSILFDTLLLISAIYGMCVTDACMMPVKVLMPQCKLNISFASITAESRAKIWYKCTSNMHFSLKRLRPVSS